MKIPEELIEEAAKGMSAALHDGPHESVGPFAKKLYAILARSALTAIYPALRKQVLETAELEALRIRDALKAKANAHFEETDQGSAILVLEQSNGADTVAARIRSLMDKE